MNLKLNNDMRDADKAMLEKCELKVLSVKEERQRTGRYIAILVGILLFLLAMYHAWVRRIPFIASLVVPAIIMFVYVGWVLYTASRDKHRALHAEAALKAALAEESEMNVAAMEHACCSSTASPDIHKPDPEPFIHRDIAEMSSALIKDTPRHALNIIKPIILVNDQPPDDDQNLTEVVIENLSFSTVNFKHLPTKRKFRRKFCRDKRNAVFKRSYSIA